MLDRLLSDPQLARVAREIAALTRECIRFESHAADDTDITVGASKLGGPPDLPRETAWPEKDGTPLAFVAQINTAELAAFPCAAAVPSDTLLSFFYDAENQPAGFDPAERGSWRVLATPLHHETLARRDLPPGIGSESIFSACILTPRSGISLPPGDSAEVRALGLTLDEWHAYEDVLALEDPDPCEDRDTPPHQLLGYAQPLQGDMMMSCRMTSNGLYTGNADYRKDPRFEALAPGVSEWRLLLQIGSDDGAGMMWGDVGRLYFCITESALRRRDFEQVWLDMQCF